MLKKEDVIRYSAGIHFSQERLFNAFLREKGIKNISISKFRVLEVLWKNKEEGIVFSGICQKNFNWSKIKKIRTKLLQNLYFCNNLM